MPDKELEAFKNGDKKAFDGLCEAFMPLIKKETGSAVSGSEMLKDHYDEIRQEALIALYDAALSYDGSKGVTFGLYAKICIRNRIISYVRKISAQKRRAEKGMKNSGSDLKKNDTPEELIEALEQNANMKAFLGEALSGYEKKVFSLYLQKKSYAEIADILGKEEKSVDNALFRVKSKIRNKFY